MPGSKVGVVSCSVGPGVCQVVYGVLCTCCCLFASSPFFAVLFFFRIFFFFFLFGFFFDFSVVFCVAAVFVSFVIRGGIVVFKSKVRSVVPSPVRTLPFPAQKLRGRV